MVIQRQWRNREQHRPGRAREHLHRWIATSSVVQRAVRAWLLRRGLQRFAEQRYRREAALVRLQALWRACGPRREFLRLRQAAVVLQVCLHESSRLWLCSSPKAGMHHPSSLHPRALHPWQAAYRGKVARREVFHHLVVPRMLEAGLARKRQVESSR